MARASKPPAAPPFEPYVVQSRIYMSRTLYVVVERSFHAVRAIYAGIAMPGVYYGIYETTILDAYLPDGPRPRYFTSERPLQSVLSGLLSAMRERGGSPEAVLLLQRLAIINEKDIDMAKAKLENKGEAPKAETTKAATKGGGKGNPEALAAARAAKETGPDTRKIKILNKENPYRAESGRATSWDALKGAKTVQDYVDAGGKKKYISRWVEEARIEVA